MAIATFNLADIDGLNGFKVDGASVFDNLGQSVTILGDFNNDGLDDIAMAAPEADPDARGRAGEAYILFTAGDPGNLGSLDGAGLIRIDGVASTDLLGRYNTQISGAGDFNGDGVDDLIVGSIFANGGDIFDSGEAYVIFGGDGILASDFNQSNSGFDLSALDGSQGFRLPGFDPNDGVGRAVSSAGDVNGDGFDDLVIGVHNSSPYGRSGAGEAFVVFGTDQSVSASFDLTALDGADGFHLIGGLSTVENTNGQQTQRVGRAVSAAGDFNGDGIGDVMVGAPTAFNGDGGAFLIFGKATGFDANIQLEALDGTDGILLRGDDVAQIAVGTSISAAGDVNGDGFDDVLLSAAAGSFNGRTNAGAHYVIFGSELSTGAAIDLTTLDATEGFRIDGDQSMVIGFGVASAGGDVNGDGFDDILIGMAGADYNSVRTGKAFVVFGKADIADGGPVDLAALDAGEGLLVGGGANGDQVGFSVSMSGDVNGDGLADILLGASRAAGYGGASTAGRVNLIFGFDPDGGITHQGTQGSDDITGDSAANGIVGADGDDILRGGGGGDTITGGDGDDTGLGHDGDDIIFGGKGADTLRGSAGDDRLSGGAGGDLLMPDDGADTVFGGAGDDRILMIAADVTATDAFDGGGGNDRIELSGGGIVDFSALVRFTSIEAIVLGDEGYQLTGGDGGEEITGGAAADTLNGGGGDDRLIGGLGVDTLAGGLGDDFYDLSGAEDASDSVTELADEGTDTLQAGFNATLGANIENLILTGTAGTNIGDGNSLNNRMEGASVADSIRGRNGDDTIIGGGGNDTLTGDAGDDVLEGGDGDDRLNGGVGADAMSGGDGDDIYTVDNVGDTVTELPGEGSFDRINVFVDFTNPEGVEFFVGLFSTVGLVLTGNSETNRITGANRINSPDTLSGEGGNDRIVGLVGDDTINGGDGNDRIFGNSGADIIDGGDGDDLLTGQQGGDTFIVGLNAGNDAISDFDGAVDLIDLSAHGFADLDAIKAVTTDVNGSAVIDLGGSASLRLIGVLENTLALDDFILT